jgi:hypothetical protein
MPDSLRDRTPTSVQAGAPFQISWTGPNRKVDRVRLVPAGTEEDHEFPDYALSADQPMPGTLDRVYLVPVGTADMTFKHGLEAAAGGPNPATVRAPGISGDYEVRYFLGGAGNRGGAVIARSKVVITRVVGCRWASKLIRVER